VGVLFLRREPPALVVEEIVVSCRALGRNIEHLMVTEALRLTLQDLSAQEIHFAFKEGPRNGPARAFLAEYTGRAPEDHGVSMAWDGAAAAQRLARLPVTIVHEEAR
jgi:predicted enzyme involved in methoxymalonyl-ACP biosynthesis